MKDSGFTLLELMIVVAVICIIATLAIPVFLRSRILTNETAAIVNLKRIVTAQAMVKAQNSIDVDGDGIGEFGNFQDLTGRNPLHTFRPSFLEKIFEDAIDAGRPANGPIPRLGYQVEIYVGDLNAKADEVDPTLSSQAFWATAYPIAYGKTGFASFYINDEGVCYGTDMGPGNTGASGYSIGMTWPFRPG